MIIYIHSKVPSPLVAEFFQPSSPLWGEGQGEGKIKLITARVILSLKGEESKNELKIPAFDPSTSSGC
jgi:hypothetical protein